MFAALLSSCGRRSTALVAVGLTLLGAPAYAQSKAAFPWAASLGGQINFLTARDHALLLRTRLDRSFDTDYNALGRTTGGGPLQRVTVLAGFEWLLSERWSGGIIENFSFDPGPTRTFQSGGFLRHSGHIGSVRFRKRAVGEHIAVVNATSREPNAGRIRFRADLDRTWHAGALGLRPRVAYEVQFDVSLQKQDAATKSTQRTVDFAVLRAELAVELTERLSIVPYVLRLTRFITAIEQRDAEGNIKVPAGARNLRFPTVGVDVRYTLPIGTTRASPATRDLPTFEGYQD
ncbi:MAG: hypothetical protein H7330_05760 [Hymenobacteraceae bacterium]|nr:hypothetical protein [Hymenobacteraceae bacterium]